MISGVRLWPCSTVRIEVDQTPIGAPAADVEARWRALLADNPRHFDGPIISVDRFDEEAGVIRAHVDRYKRLAAQPEVGSGVMLLASTLAVTALDDDGRERMLMIQRHPQTRLYGGMWEIGPSGGVEPTGASTLGLDDLTDLLRKELVEEAGLDEEIVDARVACVYVDDEATSWDVVVRGRLERSVEQLRRDAVETHWDASDAAWVALDEIGAFVDDHSCIPPTRVVLRALGLI